MKKRKYESPVTEVIFAKITSLMAGSVRASVTGTVTQEQQGHTTDGPAMGGGSYDETELGAKRLGGAWDTWEDE